MRHDLRIHVRRFGGAVTALLMGATATLSAPGIASAAASPPVSILSSLPSISCPDGWTYYGTPNVASTFNPELETDAQLVDQGFPPRPVDASLIPNWLNMILHPAKLACPKTMHGKVGQFPIPPASVSDSDGFTTANSNNWVGYAAHNNANLTDTEAQAYVPHITHTGNQYQDLAGWVGVNLGGSATHPLCQTGFDTNANNNANGSGHVAAAWWEIVWKKSDGSMGGIAPQYATGWYPNLGDDIYMHAGYSGTTCSTHFIDYNQSQNLYGSKSYSGTSIDGHAEVLAERQVGYYLAYTSSPYAAPGFMNTNVNAGVGWEAMGGFSTYPYDMGSWSDNHVIATPSWSSTTAFKISITGYY